MTRGCIPSKMMLYPAEIMHYIRQAGGFGIDVEVRKVDFAGIMERVHDHVAQESWKIELGLRQHPRVDLYRGTGEFIGDYTVKVGDDVIVGDKILLCTGSRPLVPPIPGLHEVGYLTNDDFFIKLRKLPRRVAIIGGGYIAMEFGFFLSMMGSRVTVLEMLPRIVSPEEPEVSYLLEHELSKHMDIRTGHRVVEARKRGEAKVLLAEDLETKEVVEVEADEVIVATGRRSNSDLTKPEKTGVKTDDRGWILVNEYLETTKKLLSQTSGPLEMPPVNTCLNM